MFYMSQNILFYISLHSYGTSQDPNVCDESWAFAVLGCVSCQ